MIYIYIYIYICIYTYIYIYNKWWWFWCRYGVFVFSMLFVWSWDAVWWYGVYIYGVQRVSIQHVPTINPISHYLRQKTAALKKGNRQRNELNMLQNWICWICWMVLSVLPRFWAVRLADHEHVPIRPDTARSPGSGFWPRDCACGRTHSFPTSWERSSPLPPCRFSCFRVFALLVGQHPQHSYGKSWKIMEHAIQDSQNNIETSNLKVITSYILLASGRIRFIYDFRSVQTEGMWPSQRIAP